MKYGLLKKLQRISIVGQLFFSTHSNFATMKFLSFSTPIVHRFCWVCFTHGGNETTQSFHYSRISVRRKMKLHWSSFSLCLSSSPFVVAMDSLSKENMKLAVRRMQRWHNENRITIKLKKVAINKERMNNGVAYLVSHLPVHYNSAMASNDRIAMRARANTHAVRTKRNDN